MKTGVVLGSVALVWTIINVSVAIGTNYKYEKSYYSYWSIAEKVSSIPEKSKYIDKFVEALSNGNFEGKFNALILQTPDNSFDYNYEALLSLQKRLNEIKTMDVTTFQYQTAIQQITAQEQGEATKELDVFSGIYWKDNALMLWGWIAYINWTLLSILIIVLFIVWITSN